jgi:hypothetical protein
MRSNDTSPKANGIQATSVKDPSPELNSDQYTTAIFEQRIFVSPDALS